MGTIILIVLAVVILTMQMYMVYSTFNIYGVDTFTIIILTLFIIELMFIAFVIGYDFPVGA